MKIKTNSAWFHFIWLSYFKHSTTTVVKSSAINFDLLHQLLRIWVCDDFTYCMVTGSRITFVISQFIWSNNRIISMQLRYQHQLCFVLVCFVYIFPVFCSPPWLASLVGMRLNEHYSLCPYQSWHRTYLDVFLTVFFYLHIDSSTL